MAIKKKEVVTEETENTELTLTDAELEKEIKARLLKAQGRIARQNEKIYFDMGFLMCQIVNEFPDEYMEEIITKTEKGKQIVKIIWELAGISTEYKS